MHDDFKILEIARTLEYIKSFINKLDAKEYYSENTSLLIKTISDFIKTLKKNLSKVPESFHRELLQFLNYEFIPIIRYIQRSQTKDVPWSLIPNLEKLIKDILGDNYIIILRPQWHWNYSVLISDIGEFLKSIITHFTTETDLFNVENKFHIISFPVLEKTNFLLHTIFGHELGHFHQNIYFTQYITEKWENEKVDELTSLIRESSEGENIRLGEAINQSKEIIRIYKGMVREIIPDIVGYTILGPSMLFSLYYFSLWNEDNDEPSESSKYYPPLKFRIRQLHDLMFRNDISEINLIDNNFSRLIGIFNENLEKYLSDSNDIETLKSKSQHQIAYDMFTADKERIMSFIKDRLSSFTYKIKPSLVNELIIKIEDNITPNEIDNTPVKLGDIFLSGWLFYYKMLLDEIIIENSSEYLYKYRNLSKLLLKASNQIFIHSYYIEKLENVHTE